MRLSLNLCEKLYNLYLVETSAFFTLPNFSERYKGKLEGIVGSVAQSFAGNELFPTIGSSAAAYFVKLCTQHPFRDGNKRMSVYFTDIFLDLNGIKLDLGWKYMYELAKFVVNKKEQGEPAGRLQLFVERILEDGVSKL